MFSSASSSSLGAAGQNALPAPSFVEEEIRISAMRAEWDAVADRVIKAAEACGGSAARGLPDDAALSVLADVPTARSSEFRQLLIPSATPASTNASPADASPSTQP